MEHTNTALVLLNDLLFQVKIAEAARRAGLKVMFVQSSAMLQQSAVEQGPVVIVLDLNFASADPLGTIRAMKLSALTHGIPLIGYVSHVQVDLRAAALEAGCDVVLARSAFVQNLPDLLGKYVAPDVLTSEDNIL